MSAVAAGASTSAPSGSAPPPSGGDSASSQSDRVQDIFEAVDGAGVEPSIPGFKERSEERKKPKAVKPKVEARTPANASNVEDGPADPLAEVEKYINQELGPGEQEVADRVGAEGEATDPTRGEKRFQDLANARREAEERATATEQRFEQFQSQVSQAFQQMQDQNQQFQVQNARLSAQIEMLTRGNQQQEEADPETRVMDRLTEAALKKLGPQVAQHINGLQQRLQAFEQRDTDRENLARSTENKNRYLSDADSHTVNTVLKGIPEEFITPQHREDYKSDVLSAMYAYRTNAEGAAKIVREKNLRNALLFIKAFGKSKKGAQEASAAAPPVPGRGVGNSNGNSPNTQVPSLQLLAKSGFTGESAVLDWMFAGSPALT